MSDPVPVLILTTRYSIQAIQFAAGASSQCLKALSDKIKIVRKAAANCDFVLAREWDADNPCQLITEAMALDALTRAQVL